MPPEYPYHDFTADESERQLKEVLKDLTYKPGWSFSTDKGYLRVYCRVLDAANPSETIDLTFSSPIPRIVYRDFDWVRWVFDQLRTMEFHELQEFFKVRGQVAYEPHPELGIERKML